MWSESESQRPLGEAALITRYDYSRGNVCVCVVVVWVRFVWESWLTDFSGNVRLHACHVASVRESLLKNSGTVTSAKAAQSTKITPAFIARHPAGFLLDLFFVFFFSFLYPVLTTTTTEKKEPFLLAVSTIIVLGGLQAVFSTVDVIVFRCLIIIFVLVFCLLLI